MASEKRVTEPEIEPGIKAEADTWHDSAPSTPSRSPSTASTPSSEVTTQRRKKWAPKVKTGCITCRIRRIKCDEGKPDCNRCIAIGKPCGGYDYEKEAAALAARKKRGMSLSMDVRPIEWDFVESTQYRDAVVYPFLFSQLIIVRDQVEKIAIEPLLPPNPKGTHIIIAHTLAFYLALNHGVNSTQMPMDSAALKPLWSKFYHHSSLALKAINEAISNPETQPKHWSYLSIMLLILADQFVPTEAWRAHMDGYFTLMGISGGVSRMCASNVQIKLFTVFTLTWATIANTTSPPNDQLSSLSQFSVEELHEAYIPSLSSGFPCPSYLFRDILAINKLRTQVLGETLPGDFLEQATAVFEHIEAFIPDEWTEVYDLPEKPISLLLASMYKASVTLYGILALEAHIKPLVGGERLPLSKSVYVERLIPLIKMGMRKLPISAPLSWPLALVGVASAEGPAADREFVTEFLGQVGPSFINTVGPLKAIEKLTKFWESGKTGWDDCFDEPCFVLTFL